MHSSNKQCILFNTNYSTKFIQNNVWFYHHFSYDSKFSSERTHLSKT